MENTIEENEAFFSEFISGLDQVEANGLNFCMSELLSPALSNEGNASTNSLTTDDSSYEQQTIPSSPSQFQQNAEENVKIIEQPHQSGKWRYRSDFQPDNYRKGYLKAKSKNSNYRGPAVQISNNFLNPAENYYLLVNLVTLSQPPNNIRYYHPFELEDPESPESFNSTLHGLIYPASKFDSTGIKCLQSIRVVKKRNADLEHHRYRVFGFDTDTLQLSDYNLTNLTITNENACQLAFTIIQMSNDELGNIGVLGSSTVFSEVIVEGYDSSTSNTSSSSNNQTDNNTTDNLEQELITARIWKYAPRFGFHEGGDDVVVILQKRPEIRKYGEIRATFSCDIDSNRWSSTVTATTRESAISFKTPAAPDGYENRTISVDVTLVQGTRSLCIFNFNYMPRRNLCSQCQFSPSSNFSRLSNQSNKRTCSWLEASDDQIDSLTFDTENLSISRLNSTRTDSLKSISQPVSNQSSENDELSKVVEKFRGAVESAMTNDDSAPLMRIFRAFIKESPHWLHQALMNDHEFWLNRFLPNASLAILQYNNEQKETILIHAIKTNRISVVKTLANHKLFPQILLEDADADGNSCFHLLALKAVDTIIFDILWPIHHDQKPTFDEYLKVKNNLSQTPWDCAIIANNFPIIKSFAEHSRNDSCLRDQMTGDNLVHTAVRHANLDIIRFLVESEKFQKLATQSNLRVTPTQLAEELGRTEVVEYLNAKFPPMQMFENDQFSE